MSFVEFTGPARLVSEPGYERWDGAGYPDGLRGEEIPLGARIAAISDAWDQFRNVKTATGTSTDPAAARSVAGEAAELRFQTFSRLVKRKARKSAPFLLSF